MNWLRPIWLGWILGLGLITTGCLNLEPAVDSTRYFVLTSSGPTTNRLAGASVGIGLRALVLPAYLGSDRLAMRPAKHELAYSDWLQWAEPLEAGLLRLLADELSRRLQTDRVRTGDWSRSDVDLEVEIEVRHFEPDAAGLVTLDAGWLVFRPTSRDPLHSGRVLLKQSAPPLSVDPQGTVAGMSQAWVQFAETLTGALQGLEADRQTRSE